MKGSFIDFGIRLFSIPFWLVNCKSGSSTIRQEEDVVKITIERGISTP
jgi:hypothetical protein